MIYYEDFLSLMRDLIVHMPMICFFAVNTWLELSVPTIEENLKKERILKSSAPAIQKMTAFEAEAKVSSHLLHPLSTTMISK